MIIFNDVQICLGAISPRSEAPWWDPVSVCPGVGAVRSSAPLCLHSSRAMPPACRGSATLGLAGSISARVSVQQQPDILHLWGRVQSSIIHTPALSYSSFCVKCTNSCSFNGVGLCTPLQVAAGVFYPHQLYLRGKNIDAPVAAAFRSELKAGDVS